MIINNLYALFTINYERERLALEMVQRRQLRKKVHIFKEILKVLRINERLSQTYPIQKYKWSRLNPTWFLLVPGSNARSRSQSSYGYELRTNERLSLTYPV